MTASNDFGASHYGNQTIKMDFIIQNCTIWPTPFLNVISLLSKELTFIFDLFLLQVMLCRVAALKVSRTSSIVRIIFNFVTLRSAGIFLELSNCLEPYS